MLQEENKIENSFAVEKSEWSKLTIKKISDFVQVNFEVRHFDVKLQILFHGVNMVKYVVDDSATLKSSSYALFKSPNMLNLYLGMIPWSVGSPMTPSMVWVFPEDV